MSKLLVVETSPRGNGSISRNMTEKFISEWKTAHAGGEVLQRDLAETALEFVSAPWLHAYFTPPDQHTPEMKQALALSDALVAELLDADEIVIATPVYNYNVPASLKAWVDHIVRKGKTLGMDGSGLVTDKKATVLIASGGVYTKGSPIAHRNIAQKYLELVLNTIGIEDVTVVAGGGAKAVDMGETTMEEFIGTLAGALSTAAK
ncbi:FMN-dependent NADH-azoreductase [Parasulfitobacter algicola]|uniref:FMN dependent NADH:quinone oxidoreductase n=1 Tax=Parasulfitobacter algicola TaxID=2614809 RepID=A0ABX2IWC0_9RHOB|nr:NAD(P)H-dependent oxidoreductase [Sulfitobacter algicola]NSX55177.1 NAD(P)H-dependent oxidoreductase [Sulfitobacter algicola]